MSGQFDGSTSESAPVEAPEPDGSGAAVSTPPGGEPPVAPGWSPPAEDSGGRRRNGCVIGCVVAAVVVPLIFLVLVVSLIFLGGQVQSVLKGTILFGTGGTGCTVTGGAATFPSSSSLHLAAYLKREAAAGEVLTLVATDPGGATQTRDEPANSAPVTCLYLDVKSGLAPGHYVIEYRSGAEVLSRGEFDVTP
jgi:hypothetical protein